MRGRSMRARSKQQQRAGGVGMRGEAAVEAADEVEAVGEVEAATTCRRVGMRAGAALEVEAAGEVEAATTCRRVGMRAEAALEVEAADEVEAATTCRRVGMRAEAALEVEAADEVEAAGEVEAATTCRRVGMRAEAALEGEAADDGEAAVEAEAVPTWVPAHGHEASPDWHTVDCALRAIAQRRAALDADEARWLRQAEALQIRGAAARDGVLRARLPRARARVCTTHRPGPAARRARARAAAAAHRRACPGRACLLGRARADPCGDPGDRGVVDCRARQEPSPD